jgi:hypothetical protein
LISEDGISFVALWRCHRSGYPLGVLGETRFRSLLQSGLTQSHKGIGDGGSEPNSQGQLIYSAANYLIPIFSVFACSGVGDVSSDLAHPDGSEQRAREIAKEATVLEKELRAGLSPGAYCLTKSIQVTTFALGKSFWMTWFVKEMCRIPS